MTDPYISAVLNQNPVALMNDIHFNRNLVIKDFRQNRNMGSANQILRLISRFFALNQRYCVVEIRCIIVKWCN